MKGQMSNPVLLENIVIEVGLRS